MTGYILSAMIAYIPCGAQIHKPFQRGLSGGQVESKLRVCDGRQALLQHHCVSGDDCVLRGQVQRDVSGRVARGVYNLAAAADVQYVAATLR